MNFNLPSILLAGTPTGVNAKVEKLPFFQTHPDEPESLIMMIDNSTMEKFQTCPRSSRFYCIDRREGHSSPALTYGSAIHEVLELIYLARARGEAFDHSLIEPTVARIFEGKASSLSEWRTPELAVEALTAYIKHYQVADLTPLVVDGDPFVEKAFSLCLGKIEVNQTVPYALQQLIDPQEFYKTHSATSTPPTSTHFVKNIYVHWTGKMDMVCEYNGALYILDHKTTSIGGSSFFDDFRLRQQTVGYAWAAQKTLGLKINGFILNAIIQRKPTRTGKGREFVRDYYIYEPWLLEEWENDVLRECSNFVDSFILDSFPKVTSWCFGKYGRCKYHEVCTERPSSRHLILHSDMFNNTNWSPLNK